MDRIRWRMTLDELVHACGVRLPELEHWAEIGGLGDRWREPRNQGKWRHITREAAQRAVLMSRMVKAGMTPEAAAVVAREHAVHRGSEPAPMMARRPGVTFLVSRDNLP